MESALRAYIHLNWGIGLEKECFFVCLFVCLFVFFCFFLFFFFKGRPWHPWATGWLSSIGCEYITYHAKRQDTATLESFSKLPQPLYDLTDALASEKQVILSSLTAALEHTGSKILTKQAEDNILTKQMKQVTGGDMLEVRYTERVEQVLQISCFVDD